MDKAVNLLVRLVEIVLVALLAGMVAMVFLNVVLRYGFNSGLNFSEEMSRYFFVWLAFTGAVLAFNEHSHIGVETMVRLFGRRGRLVCMLISNLIILLCAAVFFHGTWVQHPINASSRAAVVDMSLIWVYGIGYFTSAGIALIAVIRVIRILTGRMTDAEVARFAGEFEEPAAEAERVK
ncbi:TRAP transporter small permease [Pelagibacterium montanilacus]|uniref:TRAP transporter small permease n=1 Tax=Pelagibacterium montanilacus TaxID=2185280 RepID=UPI000F8F3266|nr:TRAP transporter small permease [Pelagibacterium montanilacus]